MNHQKKTGKSRLSSFFFPCWTFKKWSTTWNLYLALGTRRWHCPQPPLGTQAHCRGSLHPLEGAWWKPWHQFGWCQEAVGCKAQHRHSHHGLGFQTIVNKKVFSLLLLNLSCKHQIHPYSGPKVFWYNSAINKKSWLILICILRLSKWVLGLQN